MGKVDGDWAELTAEQKEAATTLGYDAVTWDGNGKVPCEEEDWDDLTDAQRKAAEVLGYDEDDWEGKDGAVLFQTHLWRIQ